MRLRGQGLGMKALDLGCGALDLWLRVGDSEQPWTKMTHGNSTGWESEQHSESYLLTGTSILTP